MPNKGPIILGIGAALAAAGLLLRRKKPAEAAPTAPGEIPEEAPYELVGDPMTTTIIVRHPEVAPQTAYEQLKVEPTSETELLEATAGQPLVSPVIDVVETTKTKAAIETIQDTEEAKLMALPFGGQCTTTFLDEKGNYYACVNGYAVLTIKAQDPNIETKKEEIKETGTVKKEPLTWMEKELLEQERTGYTEAQRHKMVNDYRLAHPGVSGSEAYKILFGSYLGR